MSLKNRTLAKRINHQSLINSQFSSGDAPRTLLFFQEFNNQRLPRLASAWPVRHGYRCRRVSWTTFNIVRHIGGVAQELNLIGLGGVKLDRSFVGTDP